MSEWLSNSSESANNHTLDTDLPAKVTDVSTSSLHGTSE